MTTSKAAAKFLAALSEHYGDGLAFTSAAVLKKAKLAALAPAKTDDALDDWLVRQSAGVRELGWLDGKGRRLWRVLRAPEATR